MLTTEESKQNESLALLPNSVNIHVENGMVEVHVIEVFQSNFQEPFATGTDQSGTTESGNATITNRTDTTKIPESVLQYERQLRKVQANAKSVTALSMDKHLSIVYEDSDLIVVNKPSGVLCVPGLHNKPNLLQLVCHYLYGVDSEAKSEMIVHRLDMDTSGLVVFSKTEKALKKLQAMFRQRQVVTKEYHALLCGHLPDEWMGGNIHLPLQRDHRHPPFMRIATPRSEMEAHQAVRDLQSHGFQKLVKKRPKPCHTEFSVLGREFLELANSCASNSAGSMDSTAKPDTDSTSLVRIPVTRIALTPHTGRTHQLRVHCAAIGFPIVGDPAYGLYGEAQARGGVDIDESSFFIGASLEMQRKLNTHRPLDRNPMCLHAAKLSLKQPSSGHLMHWMAATPF